MLRLSALALCLLQLSVRFVCCPSFTVPALQAMEGTRARYLLENITALRPFITQQVGAGPGCGSFLVVGPTRALGSRAG